MNIAAISYKTASWLLMLAGVRHLLTAWTLYDDFSSNHIWNKGRQFHRKY